MITFKNVYIQRLTIAPIQSCKNFLLPKENFCAFAKFHFNLYCYKLPSNGLNWHSLNAHLEYVVASCYLNLKPDPNSATRLDKQVLQEIVECILFIVLIQQIVVLLIFSQDKLSRRWLVDIFLMSVLFWCKLSSKRHWIDGSKISFWIILSGWEDDIIKNYWLLKIWESGGYVMNTKTVFFSVKFWIFTQLFWMLSKTGFLNEILE
jgi:hypothetical protein